MFEKPPTPLPELLDYPFLDISALQDVFINLALHIYSIPLLPRAVLQAGVMVWAGGMAIQWRLFLQHVLPRYDGLL